MVSSGNNDDSCDTITHQYHFGDFSCGEGFISQLTLIDEYDDDNNSVSISARQPSLTSTYGDSASLDLISRMILNDELSVDSNDDSTSVDLISQMISDDGILLGSNAMGESESIAEYCSRSKSVTAQSQPNRIRKLEHVTSCCESAMSTSKPLHTAIISPTVEPPVCPKETSRLLEVEFKNKNQKWPTIPVTPSHHGKLRESFTWGALPYLFRCYKRSKIESTKRNIMESAGEVITVNLIVCSLYFVFALYNNAFLKATEGSNALFSA